MPFFILDKKMYLRITLFSQAKAVVRDWLLPFLFSQNLNDKIRRFKRAYLFCK